MPHGRNFRRTVGGARAASKSRICSASDFSDFTESAELSGVSNVPNIGPREGSESSELGLTMDPTQAQNVPNIGMFRSLEVNPVEEVPNIGAWTLEEKK